VSIKNARTIRVEDGTLEELRELEQSCGADSHSKAIRTAVRYYMTHINDATPTGKADALVAEIDEQLVGIVPKYSSVFEALALCRHLLTLPPDKANTVLFDILNIHKILNSNFGNTVLVDMCGGEDGDSRVEDNGKADAESAAIMNATPIRDTARSTVEYEGDTQ